MDDLSTTLLPNLNYLDQTPCDRKDSANRSARWRSCSTCYLDVGAQPAALYQRNHKPAVC